MVVEAASAMTLVCAIFVHAMDALVDVVSGSEGSTDGPSGVRSKGLREEEDK